MPQCDGVVPPHIFGWMYLAVESDAAAFPRHQWATSAHTTHNLPAANVSWPREEIRDSWSKHTHQYNKQDGSLVVSRAVNIFEALPSDTPSNKHALEMLQTYKYGSLMLLN